jgi:hypothetical protein
MNEQIRADYSHGIKALAQILAKAQGRQDAETGEYIDVGGEVMRLRAILDELVLAIEAAKRQEVENESD